MEPTTQDATRVVAELNDLLKLDRDAVKAYDLAIGALSNPDYKRELIGFRADHERHIAELSQLVRSRGGEPATTPHATSSAFKLLVQAAGAAGDDRAILLAFKANERGARDRYRAAARAVHEGDVTATLARAAEDEARHYAWSLATLEELGVDFDRGIGRAEAAFEAGHARFADVLERGERAAISGGTRVWGEARRNPLGTAALAAGVGFLAAAVIAGARRR